MSVALLVPGQGQDNGFLQSLPEHAVVLETLAESRSVLAIDVLALDAGGAGDTVAAQVTRLVAAVAFARYLAAEKIVLRAAAGLSVGAFGAAVAAGCLKFADALLLVRRRAELMQAALPQQQHGMAVIEGLRQHEVERLIEDSKLAVANYNSTVQFAVTGVRSELEQLLVAARTAGAHTARMLKMGASHTPLLGSAAQELLTLAYEVPFADAEFPLLSNRTARVMTHAAAVREDLALNMAHPVRWRDMMGALRSLGPSLLVEAPPGHALTRLALDDSDDPKALAAADMRWDVLVRAARRAE
jgi:malonate decarboxylase epsilon subunit